MRVAFERYAPQLHYEFRWSALDANGIRCDSPCYASH